MVVQHGDWEERLGADEAREGCGAVAAYLPIRFYSTSATHLNPPINIVHTISLRNTHNPRAAWEKSEHARTTTHSHTIHPSSAPYNRKQSYPHAPDVPRQN